MGERGLVLDMPLNGSARDYSGAQNHGVIAGTPLWRATMLGRCLEYDGVSTKVNLPAFQFNDFTMMAWFYRYSKDTANADSIIGNWRWDLNAQNMEGAEIRFYINTSVLEYDVVTSSGGIRQSNNSWIDLGNSSINTWHHVALVFNSIASNIIFYVDGKKAASTSGLPAGSTLVHPSIPSRYFNIGYSNTNSGYFNGMIGRAKMFSRPLTLSEIQMEYRQRLRSAEFNQRVIDYIYNIYCTPQAASLILSGQTVAVAFSGVRTVVINPAALNLAGATEHAAGSGTAQCQPVTAQIAFVGAAEQTVYSGTRSTTHDPASLHLAGATEQTAFSGTRLVQTVAAILGLSGAQPLLNFSGLLDCRIEHSELGLNGSMVETQHSGQVTTVSVPAVLAIVGDQQIIYLGELLGDISHPAVVSVSDRQSIVVTTINRDLGMVTPKREVQI